MNTLSRKQVLHIVKMGQKQGRIPDFSGTNLKQMNLSGMYLSGVYFIEANLNQINLNRAILTGANFSEAELNEANLRGANLGEAHLIKAKLDQANLSGTYLSHANLRGAELRQTNLIGANLSGAILSGANLSGAILRGANLSGADLVWADLSHADLTETDLSEADLSEADLSGAQLGRADFSGANLFRTNLSKADLHQAQLIWTDLSGADLTEVNLNQAQFNRANLGEADLSGAVIGLTSFGDVGLDNVYGLDLVEHLGPSTVGVDTLSRSKGQVSQLFLRGCGLSDTQIEAAKLHNLKLTFDQITSITDKLHELLIEQAIHSCFISYAGEDSAFAKQLHDDLQKAGIRCWFAPDAMNIGDGKFKSTINRSIHLHDKLLLVLSEHSINSNWVEEEVKAVLKEETRRSETVLLPIKLDETVMETGHTWAADIRHTRHISNFCHWQDDEAYQQALVRLLQELTVVEDEFF